MFNKVIQSVAQNGIRVIHIVIEANVLARTAMELPVKAPANPQRIARSFINTESVRNIVRNAPRIQRDCVRRAKFILLSIYGNGEFVIAKRAPLASHTRQVPRVIRHTTAPLLRGLDVAKDISAIPLEVVIHRKVSPFGAFSISFLLSIMEALTTLVASR